MYSTLTYCLLFFRILNKCLKMVDIYFFCLIRTSAQYNKRFIRVYFISNSDTCSTGFVTTTRVTHATPAPLYAHGPNRKWECESTMPASASNCKDIARQLVENEPGRNIKVCYLLSHIYARQRQKTYFSCFISLGKVKIYGYRKLGIHEYNNCTGT